MQDNLTHEVRVDRFRVQRSRLMDRHFLCLHVDSIGKIASDPDLNL